MLVSKLHNKRNEIDEDEAKMSDVQESIDHYNNNTKLYQFLCKKNV